MDVDQPLDAFIQSKRTGRGGRGRGRGGNRFGQRGGSWRGRGGGGGQRRMSSGGFRQANRPRQMGGKWQHDMFQGDFNGVTPQAQGFGGRQGGGPPTAAKLMISNLDYGVSDDDIKELFREFGRLRKAEVHYDKSGRSMGTALVIFDRTVDAMKAIKQYNGVPLDGRPMGIQLMDGSGNGKTSTNTPNKASIRQRVGTRPVTNGRGGGGGTGNTRGGRGRGRGGRNQPAPTAEQLDAELDAYKLSTDTWD